MDFLREMWFFRESLLATLRQELLCAMPFLTGVGLAFYVILNLFYYEISIPH